MTTFIASFVLFATVILIASVGVIMGRRAIDGSCGNAYKNIDQDLECAVCDMKDECEKAL